MSRTCWQALLEDDDGLARRIVSLSGVDRTALRSKLALESGNSPSHGAAPTAGTSLCDPAALARVLASREQEAAQAQRSICVRS